MSVDLYSLCPCGSGKKLKFCCSDLVTDLEKVHRMIEGDQPRAALSHITQTLAKSPKRGSLLDMKAMLELSLQDYDEAQKTITAFIKADPTNPACFAQQSVLLASTEGGEAAVDALQSSLELLAEEMPTRVLQAVGAVGQALLVQGNLVAARAHLWLYQGIAGDEDTRAMELLVRLNQSAGLPLLLRDHLYLRELAPGHEAESQHDHAQVLASRGQWRRAAEKLDELCEKYPELAALHYDRGIVHGWLGHTETFVEGLRTFAGLAHANPETVDDAVEAEAIAQLLDKSGTAETAKVVRTEFPVTDQEGISDRLVRDKRTVAHQLDETELSVIDGPPPRSTWLLLDRPMPESGVNITAAEVPRMLGFVSFFGRQTDRPERIELVAERGAAESDGPHAEALKVLAELGGDALGVSGIEEVTGETAATDPVLNTRWHFPVDTLPSMRRDLLITERRRVLLEQWPTLPRPALSNKSPAEAAKEPELRLALAATILVLEQSTAGIDAEVFAQLRGQLDLSEPSLIDPNSVELDVIPLARVSRIDLSNASDEGLALLNERAAMAGANEVVHEISKIAIERPSAMQHFSKEDLFFRLISFEPDPVVAMQWVERARMVADADGKSNATWDILELELRVVNGEMAEAEQLIQHLRNEHLNEPGVAEQLYQLLNALGAIPQGGPGGAPAGMAPGGGPPQMQDAEGAASSSAGSKLWTPGDDSPGESTGGSDSKKIWTPS